MIIGIGVDVVHGYRLKRWQTIPGLLERYFHPDELRTALSRGSGAALSLAARFAAKEAFGKALGMGLAGIVLKDIMVLNQHNGRPQIQVFGTALRALEQSGAHRVHLSLTHEQDNAIALVVLEAFSCTRGIPERLPSKKQPIGSKDSPVEDCLRRYRFGQRISRERSVQRSGCNHSRACSPYEKNETIFIVMADAVPPAPAP